MQPGNLDSLCHHPLRCQSLEQTYKVVWVTASEAMPGPQFMSSCLPIHGLT